MNPIIVIPARMASTRLPGKALADIGGAPMIVQVWRRAMEARLGPVLVAAAEPEIVQAVERAGGSAVSRWRFGRCDRIHRGDSSISADR